MLVQPYQAGDLHFAYAYHVYLRWRSRYGSPVAPLAQLTQPVLQELACRFDHHILQCESDSSNVLVLVSLRPQETVAACAGKLKGQTSKWLREELGQSQPADLLAKGYFACTSGKSTRGQVEAYLDNQSSHHGYARRVLPPVFSRVFELQPDDERPLQAAHAWTVLQFHVVLATWYRLGLFGPEEGQAVAEGWQVSLREQQARLLKVSFLPDHVHVAVRMHPSVAPAKLVEALLNVGQEVMAGQFSRMLVQAGAGRLWQPSAYIGSYGDRATPAVRSYIQHWARREEREGEPRT